MARSGIAVDETIECPLIGSGLASERLLGLAAVDYKAVSVGANRFQFARTFRPTWAIVVGCIFAPVIVGLFFFLIRSNETWTATVEEDHRRVRVRITGKVLPAILISIREGMAAGGDAGPLVPSGGVATLPVHTPPGVVTGVPQPPVADLSMMPAPPVGVPGLSFGAPPAPAPPPPAPSGIVPPPGAAVNPGAFAPPTGPGAPAPTPAPPAQPLEPISVPGAASYAPPSPPPPPAPEPVAASETTNLAAAIQAAAAENSAGPVSFELRFDTGERHAMAPLVLIGRDPAAGDGDVDPVLVPIDDPARTVSKTHLAVRRANDGLWVLDRDSTNGSAIESPEGERTPLEARRAKLVSAGWTVYFGKRSFVVGVVA